MTIQQLRPETPPPFQDERRDPRVAAVLEVLAGGSAPAVAASAGVEPALLERWVGGFVDAGARQVANRPDEGAAESRDRFLTAFAHELRTPLAVAQGWVDVLAEDGLPPAMTRSTITSLQAALHRLGERVVDVELLGSSSLGLLRLEMSTVPLRMVLAGLDGLGIDVEPAAADTCVRVDVDLFRRVLRDAWQALAGDPAPRSLRLDVREDGAWTEIRVLREGDPIDPRVLLALFEPFEVNDDATGVTIGLYLARALTVAHSGTLGLEQDDTGAALWIRIPAPDPSGAATVSTLIKEIP